MLRMLVALVVLLTAVWLHAAQTTPAAKPAQPDAPRGRVNVGGVLYKKVGCYQCHANEAQGGLSGPRLGPNLFPFARFAEYIRTPDGEMPPYTSRVLSDQDIADIYAWVQARPRPPAVSTIPQLAP
jgi:ubiquinol-cytochrome c reductase cytochrome c subunit